MLFPCNPDILQGAIPFTVSALGAKHPVHERNEEQAEMEAAGRETKKRRKELVKDPRVINMTGDFSS